MKFLVHGGTHLGIVGGYGERTFDVDSIDDIEKIIREEEGLQDAKKSTYKTRNGTLVHTLVNENDLILFEYCIISEREK